MAIYPPATVRLLPENSQQSRIVPTQVILHVAAGEARSLYDWWMAGGNELESHFYVRYDGTLEQYMDSTVRADANLTANRRADGTGAISVESQGLADGEWTAAQLDTIQRLIDWAHEVHGVPLRVCQDANDPGVGWHVMFGAPGPWTNVSGKECPGPKRVEQFRKLIAPRLGAVVEVDDMTPEEMTTAVETALRNVIPSLSDQVAYGLLKALRHPEVVQRLVAIEKSDVSEEPDVPSS